MSDVVEKLKEVRDFVQRQINAAEGPGGAELPPTKAAPVVADPTKRAPKAGVTDSDIAIFGHISSKIGTIQGTFGMFHDGEMTRETALSQGKRLLDEVRMALFANPQAHFDEIRELIVNVDLEKEIDLNRGQGDLLQKAKVKADDHLSDVIAGDTDVAGDMTGVVGGG